MKKNRANRTHGTYRTYEQNIDPRASHAAPARCVAPDTINKKLDEKRRQRELDAAVHARENITA